MLDQMPPQVKVLYETMVKPKLREMHPDQLIALRSFMNDEIDALLLEGNNGTAEEIH